MAAAYAKSAAPEGVGPPRTNLCEKFNVSGNRRFCRLAAGNVLMSRKTGAPSSTSPWKGRTIAYGWQLAPVTSPLVGEVGSRALRASREGGNRSAESNKH